MNNSPTLVKMGDHDGPMKWCFSEMAAPSLLLVSWTLEGWGRSTSPKRLAQATGSQLAHLPRWFLLGLGGEV